MDGAELRIIRRGTTRPYLRGGGASVYIIEGWTKAAAALGWRTLLWDGRHAERTFEEFQPHIYLADVRYTHKVPSRVRRGETKVMMTVDQWAGEVAFPDLARDGYYTRRRHVRWVRKLDPQLLYHHTTQRGIEQGWGKWCSAEGRQVVSLPLAGDSETFFDEGTDARFGYDLGFLGGYSRYKAPGLHEYLLDFADDFSTAIYGPGWPAGTAVADALPDAQRNRFIRSVRVMPAIHEPHARRHGREITERVFKVPLARGFTIADPVDAIRDEGFFSEAEMPMARSGAEMRELVQHFLDHPGERDRCSDLACRRVLEAHTYYHRLGRILSLLGFNSHLAQLEGHMRARGLGIPPQW